MAGFSEKLERGAKVDREAVVERWFTGTGRSYDRVVAVTTFGMDAYWKRQLMAALPPKAERVLDLACGTGIVLDKLARKYPAAELVGVDITQEYMHIAEAKMRALGREVELIHSNAETAPLQGLFDTVCSSYIPKYVDPEVLLDNITPHVAPGGIVALHDFTYPNGGLQRLIWRGWMGVLRTLGSKVFPSWEKCFDDELTDVISKTHWPSRFAAAFAQRGYVDIRRKKLSFRSSMLLTARRPT